MLNRGFSLIEVLVSLLILGMCMMGMAALAGNGQRAFVESQQRAEATRYVEEMADRLRANPGAIAFYAAPTGASTPVSVGTGVEWGAIGGVIDSCAFTTASGAGCSQQQLAQFDRAWWDGLLSGAVNQLGLINPVGCIENLGGVPERARVSLVWQGMEDTADLTANGQLLEVIDCGNLAFGASNDSRRSVVLEVAL